MGSIELSAMIPAGKHLALTLPLSAPALARRPATQISIFGRRSYAHE